MRARTNLFMFSVPCGVITSPCGTLSGFGCQAWMRAFVCSLPKVANDLEVGGVNPAAEPTIASSNTWACIFQPSKALMTPRLLGGSGKRRKRALSELGLRISPGFVDR